MNAKELREYLNNSFKQKLIPFGFKNNGSVFYLIDNDKSYSISFNSLNYDNSYPTSFTCFSGFLEIEKLHQKITNNNEKVISKIKFSGQLYISQALLYEQNQYKCKHYDLYNLQEAEKAVKEIVNTFIDKILPNFKKIKTVNDLDNWYNTGDYMSNSRRLKLDIIYGLIVAKFVSNPNYETLKLKYEKLSTHFGEWDKNELKSVIHYLDTIKIINE